jgi:hypothetical protein
LLQQMPAQNSPQPPQYNQYGQPQYGQPQYGHPTMMGAPQLPMGALPPAPQLN